MISLYNLFSVARYEFKMLLRSWFFRIFVILALLTTSLVNMVTLFTFMGGSPWTFVAVPGLVPYRAIMFLNFFQAIVAIFLSSEFLKRDKKLDTSEVTYIRSLSNGDYVLGKFTGVLLVFILMNVAVLLETLIFNLIAQDVPVDLSSYATYPVLISIPTLLFLFGLSYFLMSLIKNQAVVFILLLAYVAITTFYLGEKMHNMLDFMGYRVPMAKSDFTGFSNWNNLLIQRGMYFFVGLGLLLTPVLTLQRLPQSRILRIITPVWIILFLGCGIFLTATYLTNYNGMHAKRLEYLETNNAYAGYPVLSVSRYDIEIRHQGHVIAAIARMEATNNREQPLSELVFSLNPGLKLSRVETGEQTVPYRRENQVVVLQPSAPIEPGGSIAFTMHYRGQIDERACYLDADTAMINEHRNYLLTLAPKRYAFIQPRYVLLTPESNWYPVSGVGYNTVNRYAQKPDFSRYHLNVKTASQLTVLSQGKKEAGEEGYVRFTTEKKVPRISLAIGNYKRYHTTMDSVAYTLYAHPDHDYYYRFLPEIRDTLVEVLSGMKADYERELGFGYPYKRFFLMETPLSFTSYPRLTTLAWENTQPEGTLIPENGYAMYGADFRMMQSRMGRRFGPRDEDLTEEERQIRVLRRGVRNELISGNDRGPFGGNDESESNKYTLFPSYFSHVFHLRSEAWPVINMAIESYFNARVQEDNPFLRFRGGLSANDRANIYLQNHPLAYFIEQEKDREKLLNIIHLKGEYLFTMLEKETGEETFSELLEDYLMNHALEVSAFDSLLQRIEKAHGTDHSGRINQWYHSKQMPRYIIDEGSHYIALQGNREVYQYEFGLTNDSDVEGYIRVNFQQGGRRGGFGRPGFGDDEEAAFIYHFYPRETKRIGIVLNDRTRSMDINTMVSGNIPSIITVRSFNFDKNEQASPFEGERVLDKKLSFAGAGSIIADNEDESFEMVEARSGKLLEDLFLRNNREETGLKYQDFDYSPPTEWVLHTHSECFGYFIRSVCFTRSGEGENLVIWKADIPEQGNYEVYTYLNDRRLNRGRFRRRTREDLVGTYHYTVFHADGEEEVTFNLKNAEDGWNYLGTFYFNADTAKVVLTNESNDAKVIIYADAVKFQKQ